MIAITNTNIFGLGQKKEKVEKLIDGESDNESEDDGKITQKVQEFLDAHYLNRRKSCICKKCGGEDSEPIKRMDKRAMDLLQIELSGLFREKIKLSNNNMHGFKR